MWYHFGFCCSAQTRSEKYVLLQFFFFFFFEAEQLCVTTVMAINIRPTGILVTFYFQPVVCGIPLYGLLGLDIPLEHLQENLYSQSSVPPLK